MYKKFYNNVKRFAGSYGFTLAEVLITLSILGVVAAISIPSIIQNYQKQATVSRLKMAYSMLDRLTQQSYIENGYPPLSGNANKIVSDYFIKYLNVAKDCGRSTGTPKATGCFKRGTYFNGDTHQDTPTDIFYSLDGSYYNKGGYNSNYYYKVLLKNGMSLGIYYNGSADIITQIHGIYFVVDIDGPNRGDSKMGQDVFRFTYVGPELGRSCKRIGLLDNGIAANDNNSNCTVSRQTLLNNCKEESNGYGCSGLIIKDGWKISSDYPWSYAHKK